VPQFRLRSRHYLFPSEFSLPKSSPNFDFRAANAAALFYAGLRNETRRRPLCLIGIVLNDALTTLTGEPVPNLRHLFQLLFQLEVCRLRSLLTALSGILLVFRKLLLVPTGPNHRKNSMATTGRYNLLANP
jgi:hypothetical protein